jgi:hypothetical protein
MSDNLTLTEVHKFLRRTGITERQFGLQASGDYVLLSRLRRGVEITPAMTKRVRDWIATYDALAVRR